MKARFENLAKPIKIGTLLAKNRIWMAPLWEGECTMDGEVTQVQIDHYAARAKGGAGLLNLGSVAVDSRYMWNQPQNAIYHDKFAPGLHQLVEAVHMWEVPILCQLHHAGMFGRDPIAPSNVVAYGLGHEDIVQPRALSIPEIEELRNLFIECAVRAERVGFDGVQLHGATGYILEQFFSPHNNKRTDKYGGSLQGRMHFALEIIRGMRKKLSSDYPIFYTFPCTDLIPGGIAVEESLAFAKALENEGVSSIDITIATYETFHWEGGRGSTRRQKQGLFDMSEVFKKELNVPVTTRTFGEYNPEVWEAAVARGAADAVFIGRLSWTDTHIGNKILEDKVKDIRPCINCNYCNETVNIGIWKGACAVNPGLGRGEENAIKQASVAKKVLVIGGGPGGLEAARMAAFRGHNVTLMEKEAKLGGEVLTACLTIGTEEYLKPLIDWQERQCKKLGVKIQLNKEVTLIDVKNFKPEVVIVATGATPFIPPEFNVIKPKSRVVAAEDILNGKAKVKGKVVVVGGGLVGIETAEFILAKGLSKDVTVIEKLSTLMVSADPIFKAYFMRNLLPKLSLKVFTSINIAQITDNSLVAFDQEGKRYEFKADNVVLAVGYTSNGALYETLVGKFPEVYNIGDSRKPRRITEAIHEAWYIAQQI
jgi:2,4-dienoyl-CoA reductase-like NADH-dependent reductase (Old Yellow Enzyme family)/thioredoxin reductase